MKTYIFIRKFYKTPRTPEVYVKRDDVFSCIEDLISSPPLPLHFDLETTGLQAEDDKRLITNIGLASEKFLIGLSLVDLYPEELLPLWQWLAKCKLGGFNLTFDLSWPWGASIPVEAVGFDTSVAFRYLATEALKSQPHSLEDAIEDVLAWPEEWMQKTWLKETLAKHEIKKEEMWKLSYLEEEGYTYYCALDAEASFQLEPCFKTIVDEHGPWDFYFYMNEVIPHKIMRIIEAQHHGIPIDRELCMEHIKAATTKALQLEHELLTHKDLIHLIEEWTELKKEKQYSFRVHESKEWAKKADEPWLDPETWRFMYCPDKKLHKWEEEWGGRFYKSVTKVVTSGTGTPYPRFNFSSPLDMKWLIYTKWLGEGTGNSYEMIEKYGRPVGVLVTLAGEDYELDLTDTGGLPTGGDILTLFGDIGKKINDYKSLMKMRGDFLVKFYNASERTGSIHAAIKIYGAATSRGSGG